MAKLRREIPLLLATFLLCLSVTVIRANHTSAYSASGYSWSSDTTSYYVNNVFASSFRTAFKAADATWDAAGSVFRFTYAGTTSRNPNVNSSSYSRDGYNDIAYYNGGATGYTAATRVSVSGTTIIEVDTTQNIYYGHTTVGAAGSYDVQDEMTHEFGHWLNLSDLTSSSSPSYCGTSSLSTMCGAAASIGDTNRRSLRTDDKNGIKAIYGT
jgi:hypothetical protein